MVKDWLQTGSAVVQAFGTIVLILVTWHYVTLNSELVHLQADPVIELTPDIVDQTLIVRNYGFNDVSKVRVDDAAFMIPTGNSFSLLCSFPSIKVGAKESCSFKDQAKKLAFINRIQAVARSLRPIETIPNPELVVVRVLFRAEYFREPDHRLFYTTARLVIGHRIRPGQPIVGYQLRLPALDGAPGINIYNKGLPFPDYLDGQPPSADFDDNGNRVSVVETPTNRK
jgi:hypothetical protein